MENKKPTFDPNKRYNWEPDAEFTMSGRDFGYILNTFRMVMSSQQSQLLHMVEKAASKMDFILIQAVEAGIAKEVPEPEPQNEKAPS